MPCVVVTAWDPPNGALLAGLLASLDRLSPAWPVRVLVPDAAVAAGRATVILDGPFADAVTRARAWLPQTVPGFDRYIWLDSATWVQTADALPVLAEAAPGDALSACYEIDRGYRPFFADAGMWHRYRAATDAVFGREAANLGWLCAFANGGVMALDAAAPHWAAWASTIRAGWERRSAAAPSLPFADLALNVALLRHKLPVAPLPATWNWLCHLAAPTWDGARLVEPGYPGQPIRIVHLSGQARSAVMRLRDRDRRPYLSTLRFPLQVRAETRP
ncbi:hypothetical protein EDC65_4970 [Stella humosa]|uniref:Glycosyl transferase family 2 n=1 Tax=Stella humosa TaxID=94 RepID=A0A3N1KUU4_9PROT|nr:hypothetical protein [Stella humosa]ROP81115.1 hypothetical protein EDC65_4970 [Stella humosa]BBK32460.1 hypothetical protein STHU_30940 [Stella humosa]